MHTSAHSVLYCEIGEAEPHRFKPWLSQANDFEIDTCHFLARSFALLGCDKDWLAQCQDSVTAISGHGAGDLVSQWGSTIIGSRHECALSRVNTHSDMTIDAST